MTREKAIEWLEQLRDGEKLNVSLFETSEHPRDMDNPHAPWVEMYEMAIDALREQLVTTCNQWISVKDALPTEEGSYLVATKNGGVMLTHFYPKGQCFSSTRLNRLVTHWMERPEPPEGGAGDE